MTEAVEDYVIGLIYEGVPFDEIERVIESLGLNQEDSSVLWLLAWSELGRADRRRVLQGA